MTKVDMGRLLENMKTRTTIYTPIIEGLVNSIHAIEQSGQEDGEIFVNIKRSPYKVMGFDDDPTPDVSEIEIIDNGIGFNDENRASFDTIYSSFKLEKGGKGFGRFSFIKYFESVSVKSVYEEGGKFFERTFNFATKGEDIIEDEQVLESDEKKTGTTLTLRNIKDPHRGKIDKKVETIARKLVESLLVLFADDEYRCPQIIVRDEGGDQQILNDYISKHKEIEIIASEEFEIRKDGAVEVFKVKVFKIFYSKSINSVRLAAHNREVTDVPLHNYVPEFEDEFFDEIKKEKGEPVRKNFAIKVYVMGKYLDDNVSLERHAFEFSKNNLSFNYSISQEEIEERATDIARKIFDGEVKIREERKVEKIKEYIRNEAPWHRPLIGSVDLSNFSFKNSNSDIEAELQRAKYLKEIQTKRKIEIALGEDDNFSDKVGELVNEITEIGKSDLAHYVALRKTVLDLFKKSLEIKEDGKYQLERTVHDIIFPIRKDSENLEYEKHNLWMIDERLSFHQYVSSDLPILESDERPDIAIFDNKIVVRGDNEAGNPIVIFEFKRPQRDTYTADENPIKQIASYVEEIRTGKFKGASGRNIVANEMTPAFGFLICDITPKIEGFCKDAQLNKTPDGKGYYGFHHSYGVYFEVIDFDTLVRNAELRNRIFFKKLGIE